MPKNKGCLKDDKGMALITVLLILVLLTTLGMYSVWTSNSEMALGGNERLNKTAFYATEAGLNEVMARFRQMSGQPYYVPGTSQTSMIHPNTVWAYKGIVNISPSPSTFCNYSVYIYPTFEQSTFNEGFHTYTGDGNTNALVLYNKKYQYPESPVDGGTHGNIGYPVFHLVAKGKIKDKSGNIIGSDEISADMTEDSINIGAPGGVYGGNTISWNGSSDFLAPGDIAVAAGTSQSVSGFPGTGSAENNTMENMSTFLGMGLYALRGMATFATAGTSVPPTTAWGTYAQPSILFIDNACKYSAGTPGQVTFTGGTGYGIMVVTGDLNLHGNFTWNGLVYVMGNVSKSNGTNNVNGAMMVQGTSDYTGNVTVTLNRAMLQHVCKSGFNNKLISWKEERINP